MKKAANVSVGGLAGDGWDQGGVVYKGSFSSLIGLWMESPLRIEPVVGTGDP
jgi:hypothetical protein